MHLGDVFGINLVFRDPPASEKSASKSWDIIKYYFRDRIKFLVFCLVYRGRVFIRKSENVKFGVFCHVQVWFFKSSHGCRARTFWWHYSGTNTGRLSLKYRNFKGTNPVYPGFQADFALISGTDLNCSFCRNHWDYSSMICPSPVHILCS